MSIYGNVVGGQMQVSNADTLDGKHASEFAFASDVDEIKELIGDEAVAVQISKAVENVAIKWVNF